MRSAAALCLLALCGCAGGGPAGPAASTDTGAGALALVNDDWRIVEMATAHGAFTIEVEVADGVDAAALARELIEPLQPRYAEVLVYFHACGSATPLPRLRVQWTAAGGYAETRY